VSESYKYEEFMLTPPGEGELSEADQRALAAGASPGDLDHTREQVEKIVKAAKKKDRGAHIEIHDHKVVVRYNLQEEALNEVGHKMHPVSYLDFIGEAIADVGGTASDLFESICLVLAANVIVGSKAHPAPHFASGLCFVIIAAGTLGAAILSFHVRSHDSYTSNMMRLSLRFSLFLNILFVLVVAGIFIVNQYYWREWMTWDTMINYMAIIIIGLFTPEITSFACELFTSTSFPPVQSLAKNADIGDIITILQGLGQGFTSAVFPSLLGVATQIIAFKLEGYYGVSLLACATQACSGWQATTTAFGAVCGNANRMVHLTSSSELTFYRANILSVLASNTSHGGKSAASQCTYYAVTALLNALTAEKLTMMGLDFQNVASGGLSFFKRGGMVSAGVFTFMYFANTLTACIVMSKKITALVTDNPAVEAREDRHFPQSHIVPLKHLVSRTTYEAMQLVFSPVINTIAVPMTVGMMFGFDGLSLFVSTANILCFNFNLVLINAATSWDAARRLVLMGGILDAQGKPLGADSAEYATLSHAGKLGAPLGDLSGPALNNFVKLVAVSAFVTNAQYDMTPENTWYIGVIFLLSTLGAIGFFKFGLSITERAISRSIQGRRERVEWEEGTSILRQQDQERRQQRRLEAQKRAEAARLKALEEEEAMNNP